MFIKKLLIIAGIVSILQPAGALAQAVHNTEPPDAKPPLANKAIPPAPLVTPKVAEEPVAPGLEHLNGIVILGSTNDFKPEGIAGVTNVLVKGPSFLKEHQELVSKTLSRFLGKPLTPTAMTNLQIEMVLLCRQLDRPIVDVSFPGDSQEIVNATVQILVFEGKLDHVTVKHEGKAWFNDRILTNRIHMEPGDSISQKQLLQDVARMNLNSQFREVNLLYEPGDFNPDGHGTTTVDLDAKESFPFRVFAGYDDYGLRILGENQVFAGFNYGNLFGLDQQLNYQYTADLLKLNRFEAHAASYVIPLPWGGDTLTISGGYNSIRPDLSQIGVSAFNLNHGETYQTSVRYTIPLPGWLGLNQDVSLGYDYKSANTPVQFGTGQVISYKADVDQFAVDYRALLRDRLGSSQVSGSGYYSPGGLLGRNEDSDFATFIPGLKDDYYYGRVQAERTFTLPFGMQLRGRGGLQESSTGLLPSEQLYLGGYSMLRGYPESIDSGDTGWYASAELHSPLIRLGNLTRQHNVPNVDGDTLDLFGFFDTGAVQPINPNTFLTGSSVSLDSAGGGLVWHIAQYFGVSASYGYELKDLPSSTPLPLVKAKGRFHISATLSF